MCLVDQSIDVSKIDFSVETADVLLLLSITNGLSCFAYIDRLLSYAEVSFISNFGNVTKVK